MSNFLALTQAPHASFHNGGSTASSREYWLRPTQYEENGPRIPSAVAGMQPGEFRAIWVDSAGGIFNVNSPENGAGYSILDWNPRAVWDSATQQILVGGLRIKHKFATYSDVVGDWREQLMPTELARFSGTGHWYGWIVGSPSGTAFYKGCELNPQTDSWSPAIAGAPGGSGNNGTMYSWSPDAYAGDGGLIQYGGNSQNYRVWRRSTNTWDIFVSAVGHDQHALVEYHPNHDRTLIVGGSDTAQRASLVTNGGSVTRVTDVPDSIAMSSGSWIVSHPAGCWLVTTFGGTRKLWAVWPNADRTNVTWQDLGVAPDAALTYPTAAWDADRGLVYIVATTGLYAYRPPELVNPLGAAAVTDAGDVVAVTGRAGVAGAVAFTDAGDVVAVTGVARVVGSVAASDAGDTISVTGEATLPVPVQGSVAVSDTGDAIQVVGVVSAVGSVAIADAGDNVAVVGVSRSVGVVALIDGADVVVVRGPIGELPGDPVQQFAALPLSLSFTARSNSRAQGDTTLSQYLPSGTNQTLAMNWRSDGREALSANESIQDATVTVNGAAVASEVRGDVVVWVVSIPADAAPGNKLVSVVRILTAGASPRADSRSVIHYVGTPLAERE